MSFLQKNPDDGFKIFWCNEVLETAGRFLSLNRHFVTASCVLPKYVPCIYTAKLLYWFIRLTRGAVDVLGRPQTCTLICKLPPKGGLFVDRPSSLLVDSVVKALNPAEWKKIPRSRRVLKIK